MTSNTFCVNPWITLHTKFTKGYNPCCRFRGIVNSHSIDSYVNSPELDSIKRRLLDGQAITECADCWKQESRGYTSKRQRDNLTYNKIFQFLHKDLSKPSQNFVEYYVRLGNHCNLRCTSCSSELSSGWISENKKFNLPTLPVSILPEQHEVWQHMRDHASTIGVIEFVGGEPFMMSQDEQGSLFKFLVDNGHASHIRLKYNTNGTRLPTEQLEYWPHFKAVEINVSVDGTDSRFEYLRFPAQWDEVKRNIKFYQTLPKLDLGIMLTLSVLNIGYVDDVLEFCNIHNLKYFVNMLETPHVLNLFMAEPGIKTWIADRIKAVDDPVVINIAKNLNNTKGTVSAQQILDFVQPLDQRRGTSTKDTFPELFECLTSIT